MRVLTGLSLLALSLLAGMPAGANQADIGVVYHADPARTGNYVVPGLTWNSAATLRRSPTFSGAVMGNIVAEPLYWQQGGDNGRAEILVATDQNNVYALDPGDGHALWTTNLGPIFTGPICQHGALSGVAGTPAIDVVNGTAYMSAAILDSSGVVHARVFALSLNDGSVLPGWPLDIGDALAAKGIPFQAAYSGQRGALALVNGELYVPFGGNRGDCQGYHGTVVGVDVNAPGILGAWTTRASRGGIWGEGGVVFDGNYLFMTTGNAIEPSGWGDGEGVFRLNPNLQHSSSPADYFVPTNFQQLDAGDLDLGGTAPVQIDVNGPGGRQHWLLQLGKDGNAYVLNRSNLGGMGGALLVQQVANSEIKTGPATYETPNAVYVAFNGSGSNCPGGVTQIALTTLVITATPRPAVSTAWCGSLSSRGSPMLTTTDGSSQPIFWIAGAGGGDRMLHGYRADTGSILFSGGGNAGKLSGLPVFSTILAAGNRLFVGGAGRLYAFDFTPGL